MASRSGQVMLSCPSSLQGHSDFPSAPDACLAGFPDWPALIAVGSRRKPGDLRSDPRLLSLHAVDLTPGPPPVHVPFSYRRALAFPPNVRGRRVSPFSRSLSPNRALPTINARSNLTRLHHSFSYYGLQIWLAPLIGFAAPCRGKFRPDVATRTRPQPTYLQRQLVWRAPFIPQVNGS